MKVDNEHKEYTNIKDKWERMRDAVAGEDEVKSKGTKYLPNPSGIEKKQDYNNYKTRARYPEMIASAIEGMVGLMSRKLNSPELPSSLEYLRESATPDGLPLNDLRSRIWGEVCTVGRFILFVDVPEKGGNPYIATYPAENVINWQGNLDLVVFKEIVEQDTDDPFVKDEIEQYRVASLEENKLIIRIWQKDKEDEFFIVDEYMPKQKGKPLDFIPVVFVGSRDILPDPDAIPLLGVANKSLHFYRQYADYAMQLYMAANGTTPYVFGVKEEETPKTIGPTALWRSENSDVNAGYIEVSGTGLEAQKNELNNIAQEIADATIKVLGDKKAAEAAETLRLRFQSQTATLSSIARSSTAGLRLALTYCAIWLGANEEEIEMDENYEFISEEADAQILTALYDGIERGFIPDDILVEYLRKVEMHDMPSDEFRKWAAAFMSENG